MANILYNKSKSKEKEDSKVMSPEENNIRRANLQLENIDALLQEMVDKVIIQYQEEISSGTEEKDIKVENFNEIKGFKTKINAININGNEDLLRKINVKYKEAINILEKGIEENDEKYKTVLERSNSRN